MTIPVNIGSQSDGSIDLDVTPSIVLDDDNSDVIVPGCENVFLRFDLDTAANVGRFVYSIGRNILGVFDGSIQSQATNAINEQLRETVPNEVRNYAKPYLKEFYPYPDRTDVRVRYLITSMEFSPNQYAKFSALITGGEV